ncbi:MAG: ABC transporter permease [Gemmatimonadetes bacterium]|nr:ABC transporter permease [Gemmatimonadota bacterium]NNM05711.1 ABC transporter permease [Gemmatimonadota bacterium]
MIRLVLRRMLGAIPLLLGVASLVFIGLSLAPGDAATMYVPLRASPEIVDQVRRSFGLDDPILIRYGKWLLAFLQGDFGYSLSQQMWVRDRILVALPNTLILASSALLLSFVFGILVGVLQAVRQNTLVDGFLSGITLFFYSIPSFWLALMLILVFSVGAGPLWGWPFSFPSSGMADPGADLMGGWEQLKDRIHHLALPVVTLSLILTGGIARYVRTSMLDVIRQDYIRTARAKGLPESQVILKHGVRNGLIPVVTLFGVYFPFLLSGTVLIEYVFAWPGIGQLMVESIHARDFPVVLAVTFLFGSMVILGNLVADILYGVVDPRIRHGHG